MFTSGSHLAVSASAHPSPELMGALSTAAFQIRRKMPSSGDAGLLIVSINTYLKSCRTGFCPSSGDVRGCAQQVVDFHSRLMSRHPQDVCGPGVSVSNVATLDSPAERCNYIVLHEKWNDRDRGVGGGGGRERSRKLLPLRWQLAGRDGGPLMVGPVCIFVMSNWGSEDHLFMSLHL